jgi:hypothetical protein
MSIRVGVSTLSLALVGGVGRNGIETIKGIAKKADIGLQLDMLKGWDNLYALPPSMVISTERLLAEHKARGHFMESDPERYEVCRRNFPQSIDVRYVPSPTAFIHMKAEIDWMHFFEMAMNKEIAGIVADTWHALHPGDNGEQPFSVNPKAFVNQVERLRSRGVKILGHLQPEIFPKKYYKAEWARNIQSHNWYELFAFIQGVKSSKLSYMMKAFKGDPDAKIIIEIDPKIGILITRWGMIGLLKMIKQAVLREIN